MTSTVISPIELRLSASHPDPSQPDQPAPGPGGAEPDSGGDDIPDLPPTEPAPAPIGDPLPPGQPKGPYIVAPSNSSVSIGHRAVS